MEDNVSLETADESHGKDDQKKVIKEKQLDPVRIKEREDFKAPSKFLH